MQAGSAKSKKHGGPQAAYKRDGFGGVWKWAKGHGLKRWLKARNWARRRAKQAKDPEGFKKAEAAYEKKVKWLRDHKDPHPPKGDHLAAFDGKPTPKWIAEILGDARASGIWTGSQLSGQRSPEYSEQLCYGICGAPSCPGRCAGRSSNHCCPPTFKCGYPEGASDVTDPAGLDAYCRSHNKPLIGNGRALPADLNHFSRTGR